MNIRTFGVMEAVNTIIGKEIKLNATELLKSPANHLMETLNMTERQALRIQSVSLLNQLLIEESHDKQVRLHCGKPEQILEKFKDLLVNEHALILALNASSKVVGYKIVRLPQLNINRVFMNDVFRFLFCEPCCSYSIIVKGEDENFEQFKILADELYYNGEISNLNLVDFIVCNEDDFISFKTENYL